MRSFFATLLKLIIPGGATATTPRIEIGGGLPTELVSTYDAAGITLTGGMIFHSGGDQYGYMVQGIDSNGDALILCGGVDSGIVQELWSTLVNSTGASFFIGDNNIGSQPGANIPVRSQIAYSLPNSGGASLMAEIARSTRTSSVGPFTAETVVDTVTANLENACTYRIRWLGHISSTVADGYARHRIRLGSTTGGTQLNLRQTPTNTAANQSFPAPNEAYYTATADGDQAFCVTVNRQAGTGNLLAAAAADTPTYLAVDLVAKSTP